ncbi:MAG TPA: hypothetical protein VEB00_03820 [Clostridia bacterium]|nr:hypothetical protein [Clostridia bacterium]
MGWIIFFISSILMILLIKPYKKWSQLWYAGLITMAVLYAIDSTLIAVGAFSYQYPNPLIGELPTLYWLSSFFGGVVLAYYYPQRKLLQFPYILLSSFLFLLLELIMHFFRYIKYHNWSPINSLFLDLFGFIIVIWIWNWINEIRIKQI